MRLLLLACLLLAASLAWGQNRAVVDFSVKGEVVPEAFWGTGYDGWHDILSDSSVELLQEVGIHFCRISANLEELAGEVPGDLRLDYTTPNDVGVGFVDRLARIKVNGWQPLVALSIPWKVPKWFYTGAKEGKPFWQFNLDGSEVAQGAESDQLLALERFAEQLAQGLKEEGFSGLTWETIYEIGHEAPMPALHYHIGRGIRMADPTAKLMGPATWPGWTVEERFVKPYLAKYGPDLLDYVSVHWYATNEHGLWARDFTPGETILTMADRDWLECVMETAPKFPVWCASLRKLLDDPILNPTGRHIGIVYSEYDANAHSAYLRGPDNVDWPAYRADADPYVNTNYFGGVWNAAVVLGLASSGQCEAALKFTTRNYYGIVENKDDSTYFPTPLWFAWRLLQQEGGLVPGARVVAGAVTGPLDTAAERVEGINSPWVQVWGITEESGQRLVVLNRSLDSQPVTVRLTGLSEGQWKVTRFVYDQARTAPFIGRKPGTTNDGQFQWQGEGDSGKCLEQVDELPMKLTEYGAEFDLTLGPISFQVLKLEPGI